MKQKKALIIRHVPYEGVAGYTKPIEAAGYHVDRIDVTDPDFAALDLREHDLLIMMGGPMGVYEQDRYPWIACQMRRLALRLEADLPTLGVCFGAQMIAAALGAHVSPGPVKEVGFHPVRIHDHALDGPLRHLVDVPILHWHGDTFTSPGRGTARLQPPLRSPGLPARQLPSGRAVPCRNGARRTVRCLDRGMARNP